MKSKIFSILFALTLVLGLSLALAVPAVSAAGPSFMTTTGSGTAVWSTAASHSGTYSALLTATFPDSASAGVPVNNILLKDITQLSFWYNHLVCTPASGHVLGPDMVLIMHDPISGHYYLAGRGGAAASVGVWIEANPITPTNFASSSTWWYGTWDGTNYASLTPGGGVATFALLQAALPATTVVLGVSVNLDPPGSGSTGSVYVDDIMVNNINYDLEPTSSTTVYGTIVGPTIVITAPSGFALPTFHAGWNTGSSATAGTVTVTAGSDGSSAWTVEAKSTVPQMASSVNLADFLLIGQSTIGPWFIANGGAGTVEGTLYSGALTYSGTGLTGSLPFAVDQFITPSDSTPGVYTITITFTGSVTP
jgi:hypothetical protein